MSYPNDPPDPPSIHLVPGVAYQVTGDPPPFFLQKDSQILYRGKTTSMVGRGESESVLHFVDPFGKALEVTAETLEGLTPIVPQLSRACSPNQRRLVTSLVSLGPDGRAEAVLSLAKEFSEEVFWLVWQVAEYDDERTLRFTGAQSVRDALVTRISRAVPEAIEVVETACRVGKDLNPQMARSFLAHGHSLFFAADIEQDLQSPRSMVRRSAIEELGLIGRPECQRLLELVLNDPNPSVALKAQYTIARLTR